MVRAASENAYNRADPIAKLSRHGQRPDSSALAPLTALFIHSRQWPEPSPRFFRLPCPHTLIPPLPPSDALTGVYEAKRSPDASGVLGPGLGCTPRTPALFDAASRCADAGDAPLDDRILGSCRHIASREVVVGGMDPARFFFGGRRRRGSSQKQSWPFSIPCALPLSMTEAISPWCIATHGHA